MRASERAYARLRADVLDGVLAPGTVLAEVEQSVRLGVSRTPVREAFARLLTDGLVAPLPGRGLVVTQLSAVGVDELHEVREALEEQAVRLAARRGDPAVFAALAARFTDAPALVEAGEEGLRRYDDLVGEFEAALDAAVANAHLVAALATVRTHLVRVRRLARHDPVRLRHAAEEHQLVAEAIAAGDGGLAAHAMHVHLHRSRRQFLAAVTAADDVADSTPRPQEVPA